MLLKRTFPPIPISFVITSPRSAQLARDDQRSFASSIVSSFDWFSFRIIFSLDLVLPGLHAIRLEGTTAKSAAARVPHSQYRRPAHARLQVYHVPLRPATRVRGKRRGKPAIMRKIYCDPLGNVKHASVGALTKSAFWYLRVLEEIISLF